MNGKETTLKLLNVSRTAAHEIALQLKDKDAARRGDLLSPSLSKHGECLVWVHRQFLTSTILPFLPDREIDAVFEKIGTAWEEIFAALSTALPDETFRNLVKAWRSANDALGAILRREGKPPCSEALYIELEHRLNEASENFIYGNSFAKQIADEIRKQPLPARLVDVAPSAGKRLRTALKDPGGRPKKKDDGTKIATQSEMATSFGAPCTESKIANWEAYERTNGQRGSRPFGFVTKDGERIIYSAELRTKPTPDNEKRLTALIAEFQSRHRIKEAIGEKARRFMSSETLAKASGQVDAAIREQSKLKYEK